MSNSVQPHRQQPTRLPCSRDSPGKNTGVGCHFLLQCMKVKRESEVAQSCLTLSDPMDCSLPGSCIHRIFQAKVLEWGAVAFSGIITKSYTTPCNPVDYNPTGSSVHGISQVRILEWVAISSSRGIFPTQGSNLNILHLPANSLPLELLGKSLLLAIYHQMEINS